MRKCSKCEHEYADEFSYCPHCGTAYVIPQQTMQGAIGGKQSLLERLGDKGVAVVKKERTQNTIQNAIILAMSLILFVCAFLTGVKVQVSTEFDVYIPVQQNFFQLIDGTLAIVDSEEKIISDLDAIEDELSNAMGQGAAELGNKYDILSTGTRAEIDAWSVEVGKYISKSNAEPIKYYTYMGRMMATAGYTSERLLGTIVSVPVIAMQIGLIITTLIYAIKALIALLQHKAMNDPIKTASLPLAFVMARFVAMMLHPSMRIDEMGIVLVVFSALFLVLLGIYQLLFVKIPTQFSIMVLSKKLTLLAVGCIAFFVACGTMYLLHGFNAYKRDYIPVDGNNVFLYGVFMSENSPLLSSSVAPISWAICATYFALMVVGAKLVHSALKYSCVNDDAYFNKNPLKAVISCSICGIVFSSFLIALMVILKNTYDSISPNLTISMSANIIISLIMFIALLVINGFWKVAPKQNAEQQA